MIDDDDADDDDRDDMILLIYCLKVVGALRGSVLNYTWQDRCGGNATRVHNVF